MQKTPRIIFYGTSRYAVMVLQKLVECGLTPEVVVTTPDKPAGKKLEFTPSPVKVFAEEHDLDLFQPESLKNPEVVETLREINADLGIVVAYGKIIPQEIIDLPQHSTLNVHASLLPKLRGASPIETAILENQRHTGVTIMQIDAEMDHGPIVIQEEILVEPWPPTSTELGNAIVEKGAELLVKIIPDWIAGKITPTPQDHSKATLTRKITKADGEIDIQGDAYDNFLKIQAFHQWPGTFFFAHKGDKKIRVIIKKAHLEEGALIIDRVVPEGKKEMDYDTFILSL